MEGHKFLIPWRGKNCSSLLQSRDFFSLFRLEWFFFVQFHCPTFPTWIIRRRRRRKKSLLNNSICMAENTKWRHSIFSSENFPTQFVKTQQFKYLSHMNYGNSHRSMSRKWNPYKYFHLFFRVSKMRRWKASTNSRQENCSLFVTSFHKTNVGF